MLGRRKAIALGGGVIAALAVGLWFTTDLSGQDAKPCGLEMRVLVVSADGKETDLPAITQTLEYLGTPYTTYIATRTPGELRAEFLGEGCHVGARAGLRGCVLLPGAEIPASGILIGGVAGAQTG